MKYRVKIFFSLSCSWDLFGLVIVGIAGEGILLNDPKGVFLAAIRCIVDLPLLSRFKFDSISILGYDPQR